ncbi:hypothetical protein BFJ69_g12393 [Fusarium oxysporum]|uniref:DUF7492 domain-containing protein n=1 Tax=Fusarium oxysporum TaxID=5507 RepID=A0A420MP65_FUSOX|nr:hypothetical protein BFJ69_g12393 [Fusarium oxysporum]
MLLTFFSVVLTVAIAPSGFCHSWVERLMKVELNGTMVGEPGYIRGTISRLEPEFTDGIMQSLITRSSQPICKGLQASRSYTPGFPPLKARAGDFVALQYQENGHVTLLQNSPHKLGSGTVSVYGTSFPLEGDHLASVYGIWNSQGTGGDARGRLLGTWNFDDGQCYQINDSKTSKERQTSFQKHAEDPFGADLWCQIDVRLPADISSWYTLYWVWDWPDVRPGLSKEIYTSCMDVEVLPGYSDGDIVFVEGQDLNFAAIKDQLSVL